MKKRTIWTIACIMALTFTGLIYTQMRYFDEVVEARQAQFDGAVGRVLARVAYNLEMNETRATVEREIEASDDKLKKRAQAELQAISDSIQKIKNAKGKNYDIDSNPNLKRQNDQQLRHEKLRQRVLHQKDILTEVVYTIGYKPLFRSIDGRVNYEELDRSIQQLLQRHHIDSKYHFRVTTYDGRELYRCSEYEDPGHATIYSQVLFPSDPPSGQGIIYVHFTNSKTYVFATARLLIPALVFTFILLAVFIYSIYIIFRQKRLTEMKTDFVNNMTHEFKTPISSISLAAQMLSDPVVSKNEVMLKKLARIISDESRRLRFQVDKVLQTSLFERGKAATFKMDELDANSIIEDVAHTFTLKVQNVGGTISTHLEAEDPIICADKMHFTNVIFNLLDNALKYCKSPSLGFENSEPLHVDIRTANEGRYLKIYITDNGIGIRKADLKRIFDRFYRVSTGNRHDVKGFGLGLAYVSSVVQGHRGSIHAESVFGQGTTFIISLPLMDAVEH